MKIKMIYLAAGNSRRFFIHGEKKNKLLETIHGKPLYQYGLEQLKKVAAQIEGSEIYVVTQYWEIYDACIQDTGITVVFSPESKDGMSYSIKNGLREAKEKEDECYLFLAADQPFIRADTIKRFLMEFLSSGKKAGSVMYDGMPGNPTIFCQEYAEELMDLQGDQGGRVVLKRHPEHLFWFPLKEEQEQKDVDTFLDLCEGRKQLEMPLKPEKVIYVVGSGGKTSLIHSLAESYKNRGKKVLILTTTHMRQEKDMIVVGGNPETFVGSVRRALEEQRIVMAGKSEDSTGKFTWIGKDLYQKIRGDADLVLIEADGSKGLPAKFPNETEPVICEDADQIFVVFGLRALGKKMKDACHRYPLAGHIAGAAEIIDEKIASELLMQGYLCRLEAAFPNAELSLVFNQVDDENLKKRAEELAKLVKKEAILTSFQKE